MSRTQPQWRQEEEQLLARDAAGEDVAAQQAEARRELRQQQVRLRQDARALLKAANGWNGIRTEEEWRGLLREAGQDYDSGRFLIEQLGAERHLDPTVLATLLILRRRLIDEEQAATAAETMLVDMVVLGYYNTLRVQGWIGNLAMWAEQEWFGMGLGVASPDTEDKARRLQEQLLPLLERANRMMLRNLKGLQERRQAPGSNVNIGAAAQVNVG